MMMEKYLDMLRSFQFKRVYIIGGDESDFVILVVMLSGVS